MKISPNLPTLIPDFNLYDRYINDKNAYIYIRHENITIEMNRYGFLKP